MGKRACKRKKGYVDLPRDISKPTSLINGPGNLSDECKVLNYFVTKYARFRTFKEDRKEHTSYKICGKKQDINDIVQQAVNDIILQEK